MIQFLDLQKFKKGLKPVTSTEFFSKPGEWHPEGLFSEIIFGAEESSDRKKTFSYINLNAKVIHPSAYMLLIQLDRKIEKFLSTEETYSLSKDGTLEVDPEGVTGLAEFIKLIPKIKFRGGTDTREKFITKIKQAIVEGGLFVDTIPVIPPEQRNAYQDEKGMWIYDPLNDHYVALIRRAHQIKSASKSGPLFDLLNYELQKAVIAHDAFIRKLIQKKNGLIRSSLLAKRTDFSGRAVITPGPNLKVNEIGIPLRMAVSLFEPFIIHRLFHSGKVDPVALEKAVKDYTKFELSIDSIRMVFKAIKNDDKVPPGLYKIIWDATEVAMMGRKVLAKRDPALHAESVRGFTPILVGGNSVQICTLQVVGFGADFDGDTMAIYHPITNEAQEEVTNKMMRGEGGDSNNAVTFELSKEMCVGLYALTKNVKRTTPPIAVTPDDLVKATDPYIPVKFRGQNTTMGKAIFNSVFPTTFPFVDDVVTKKIVNGLIPVILQKYGRDQAIETFSALERIGFKFATIVAPSFSLDDIEIPDSIVKLKKKLEGASTEEAAALLKQMEKLLVAHLKDTGLYDLVESGAGKGWTQPMQILVAKGLISDPNGKVLPAVTGSFAEGLTNEQYFAASAGSRKGIIDRVLNTADTGYMSRQLAYVLNTVEIDRQLKDCKTKRHLSFRMTKEMEGRFNGRFVVQGNSVKEFDANTTKVGSVINLRSPILCESPKLCHTCYGRLLERHRTPYAGVLAAQLVGEAGTQTIMRTFHTGGAVKIKERDIRYDIIQNDPLTTKDVVMKKLGQNESELFTKYDMTMTLLLDDYPLPNDMVFNDTDDEITVKSLVCKVEYEDSIFNIVLDYPVILKVYEQEKVGKDILKLTYDKDSTIMEIPMQTDDTKAQIQYVRRLLGGREIYKDENHLFLKLFGVYGGLRSMDSVHLEVLLSQALRDKKNPSIPARLGPKWDPIMINIKQIVFKTSFIQGLAFENINEAIKTGLVTEDGGDPSILEKVLTGTLVEDKKRRR
jgi:DNA-directed RNA polymerase beta' subunit